MTAIKAELQIKASGIDRVPNYHGLKMRINLILFTLLIVVGCSPSPSIEGKWAGQDLPDVFKSMSFEFKQDGTFVHAIEMNALYPRPANLYPGTWETGNNNSKTKAVLIGEIFPLPAVAELLDAETLQVTVPGGQLVKFKRESSLR